MHTATYCLLFFHYIIQHLSLHIIIDVRIIFYYIYNFNLFFIIDLLIYLFFN